MHELERYNTMGSESSECCTILSDESTGHFTVKGVIFLFMKVLKTVIMTNFLIDFHSVLDKTVICFIQKSGISLRNDHRIQHQLINRISIHHLDKLFPGLKEHRHLNSFFSFATS